jgi:hypothetical protein
MSMRNSDVHIHVCDAERAVRAGDAVTAYDQFFEAGACAEQYGLWKTALRCYRSAVEINLFAPAAVKQLARIALRAGAGGEWADYAAVLAREPTWPRVTCRAVQLLVGTTGAVVACAKLGTVLELVMTADDLIEVRPEARFTEVPAAMALLLLRRALWPVTREAAEPFHLRVTYRGTQRFHLFETGDWSRL